MKYWIILSCLSLSINTHNLSAQTSEKDTQSLSFSNSQILQRAQTASVQITSRAIDNAASARTLGKERQGSGVVIRSDGLILTIGYLILETEQIEI